MEEDSRSRDWALAHFVVRVAGYSAYFTQLNTAMQDEVIARTELSLADI